MRRLAALMIALSILTCLSMRGSAQEPSQEEREKEQAALQEKALKLLDAVIAEGQTLRLPENRFRVQLTSGDLLWDKDLERARGLFSQAAATLSELIRGIDPSRRQSFGMSIEIATQLRRELITRVGVRDAKLAQDFLHMTRMPTYPDGDRERQNQDVDLEAGLLAQIAASDPNSALQQAEEILDKGGYPRSLVNLLSQLQVTDKSSATKLADKLVKKLRTENLSTNTEAAGLAFALLNQGPRPMETSTGKVPAASGQVLDEAAFRMLMDTVVTAALAVTPSAGGRGPRGPFGGGFAMRGTGRDDASAMRLVMGLQQLLPQIEKYSPSRATAARQKLSETGFRNNGPGMVREQYANVLEQGSVDSILQAAGQATPEAQVWLYRSAAMKALSEGNVDRATQIANEHMSGEVRQQTLQSIDRQKIVLAAGERKLEETRAMVARLGSDRERVNTLIQVGEAAARQGNKKVATQLLEEARALIPRRAENYEQLGQPLGLARAYAGIDPALSFDVLEPGIAQINEMLPAAALLSGFDLRVFRDGELPLRGDSQLGIMINRYADQLSLLARVSFEGAQATAERFQRPEPHIIARLAIVTGVLRGASLTEAPGPRPFQRRP